MCQYSDHRVVCPGANLPLCALLLSQDQDFHFPINLSVFQSILCRLLRSAFASFQLSVLVSFHCKHIFVTQLGDDQQISCQRLVNHWDTAIFHPADMAKLAQHTLSERREVQVPWCWVLKPLDAEDVAKVAHVKIVQLSLLFGVCCASFAAI